MRLVAGDWQKTITKIAPPLSLQRQPPSPLCACSSHQPQSCRTEIRSMNWWRRRRKIVDHDRHHRRSATRNRNRRRPPSLLRVRTTNRMQRQQVVAGIALVSPPWQQRGQGAGGRGIECGECQRVSVKGGCGVSNGTGERNGVRVPPPDVAACGAEGDENPDHPP